MFATKTTAVRRYFFRTFFSKLNFGTPFRRRMLPAKITTKLHASWLSDHWNRDKFAPEVLRQRHGHTAKSKAMRGVAKFLSRPDRPESGRFSGFCISMRIHADFFSGRGSVPLPIWARGWLVGRVYVGGARLMVSAATLTSHDVFISAVRRSASLVIPRTCNVYVCAGPELGGGSRSFINPGVNIFRAYFFKNIRPKYVEQSREKMKKKKNRSST